MIGGLADKAKAIIELSERGHRVERPHDIGAMVEAVVDEMDADVEVSGPPDCWVWADDRYQTAVHELVENAVQHGDPPVRVDITVDGDRVHTRIYDAGSGIPDHESAIVDGETDITPLAHASGLGLWLARVAAEANGGTLRFEETDDGTVSTLSHRRAAGPAA